MIRVKAAAALAAIGALVWLLFPSSGAARNRKEIMVATKPAVVMVVAARVDGGKVTPVSSGSGSIVHSNGSVLTNHHVLKDAKTGALHDLFVIGMFRSDDREPQFVCAGKPSRGQLEPAMDLALIRCDMDMGGRPFEPRNWPAVEIGRSEDVVVGEQVWVLGYPNVGGSTIHVTAGLVSGWTGERGGAGSRAYMKTDAAITHGNSGGTAIDENGKFIGIPTAFRVSTEVTGNTVATVGKVGLIRPVEHARALVRAATAGTHIPSGTPGSRLSGQVLAAANGRPILGAFVIVFRPGVKAKDVALDKLESQALAWGQSNAAGRFQLTQPVPRGQIYTALIVAQGYRPRLLPGGLMVPDNAPDVYQPWKPVMLERP